MKFALFLKNIISLARKYSHRIAIILKLDILYRKFKSLQKLHQIFVGIVILLLYIGVKMFFPSHPPMYDKVVEVYKATREDFKVSIKLLGRVEAKKFFTVEALNPGIIEYIAEAGAKLTKNERIASLDAPEIEEAYKASKKSVEIEKAQYEREFKLFKAGNSSKYKVEQRYVALSNASNILARAKQDYDKVIFNAPFDGIVGSPLLFHGSKVNPGDKIVTFYDDKDLVVKFDIPSSVAARLPDKTKVRIGIHEYEVFIQRALSKNSYTIPAFIEYICQGCIIGEIVDIDLYIAQKEDVIVLPTSCVFIQNGAHAVYKIEGNQATLAIVEVGDRQGDRIEVKSGVVEGDIIVKEGQGRLYPTVKVKIHGQ